MTRACLSLLAGLYLQQLSSFTIGSDLTAPAFVASFFLLSIRRFRSLGFFLVGVLLFSHAAHNVIDSRIAPEIAGDSIVVDVRVDDFPAEKRGAVSFMAVPVDDARLPARLRLSWSGPPVRLRAGDIWQLELRLRRPRGASNPGVFDYEEWLFREGVGAVGYVVGSHRNFLIASGAVSVIGALRQRFVDRVSQLLPDSGESASLAALVVGARHAITAEQWSRYAHTGTSHLIAISGLHIGLAAGGGYLLALVLGAVVYRHGNGHRRAVAVSVVVAMLYALVAGLAVPARRAGLMLAIAGVALVRRRLPRPSTVVGVACIGIVIAAPLATMAPGFKLSFAAVVTLLWSSRCHVKSWQSGPLPAGRITWFWEKVRLLGLLQVVLLLGLLPLSATLFGRIAFAAPIVNFVAVPLFSLVTVPFALLGMLMDGPLQGIGDIALMVAARSIALLEWIVAHAAGVDWLAPPIASVSGVALMYACLPALWVIAPPGWPGRYVALPAVAAMLLHAPDGPAPGCFSVRVLDVGQGLATVVRTQGHVLVYDTGPSFRGGGSAADAVVLPYLASRGISRIDYLVVSHADLDHAGGVRALLAGLEVSKTFSGEVLDAPGASALRCRAGDHWEVDGVAFHFLNPPAGSALQGNDSSCVLLVSGGGHRILLTGDIEKPAEQRLSLQGTLDRVSVVVVPHHGSRTSSTPPFVRALRPSVAIVSAGFQNRWGFPKPDVVERWRGVGARVLATANSGAIGLLACESAKSIRVGEHRKERHRIWHE